jgi:putative oxidoreductase
MQQPTPIKLARLGYTYLISGASHLQSAFLLGIRIVWGFELFETGSGKLFHIEKPIAYFTSLGIPFPIENAYLVGGDFIVAYLTTEQDALHKLVHLDPDAFISADPFTYLLASIILFLFGPGAYSVDGFLKKFFLSPPRAGTTQSVVAPLA